MVDLDRLEMFFYDAKVKRGMTALESRIPELVAEIKKLRAQLHDTALPDEPFSGTGDAVTDSVSLPTLFSEPGEPIPHPHGGPL
jgi:hypothetical protein